MTLVRSLRLSFRFLSNETVLGLITYSANKSVKLADSESEAGLQKLLQDFRETHHQYPK